MACKDVVNVYNSFGGVLYGIFPNVGEAAKAIGATKSEVQLALQTGEVVNHRLVGYYYVRPTSSTTNKIQRLDSKGNVVGGWKTIVAAAAAVGIHRNTIGACIKSGKPDYQNYYWKKL